MQLSPLYEQIQKDSIKPDRLWIEIDKMENVTIRASLRAFVYPF